MAIQYTRWLAIILVGLGLLAAVQAKSESDHVIEVAVWIKGQPHPVDQPVVLDAGRGVFEIAESHRFEFQLEPVDDPLAPEGSVWLTVSMSEWNEASGQWDFITDTLLGAPLGQDQVFSLAQSNEPVSAQSAEVYLVATVHTVRP